MRYLSVAVCNVKRCRFECIRFQRAPSQVLSAHIYIKAQFRIRQSNVSESFRHPTSFAAAMYDPLADLPMRICLLLFSPTSNRARNLYLFAEPRHRMLYAASFLGLSSAAKQKLKKHADDLPRDRCESRASFPPNIPSGRGNQLTKQRAGDRREEKGEKEKQTERSDPELVRVRCHTLRLLIFCGAQPHPTARERKWNVRKRKKEYKGRSSPPPRQKRCALGRVFSPEVGQRRRGGVCAFAWTRRARREVPSSIMQSATVY